jgi:L-serine/L-threonine ammonia-lyase
MKALEICSKSQQSAYISPFDNPMIWSGNSSVIDEIRNQLDADTKPDCIITSVGGGGLLNGIIEGLIRNNWMDSVDIITAETEGANCFNLAINKGEIVTMEKITRYNQVV